MPNEPLDDDSNSQDTEFVDFLAAYDEALAAGLPLPDTQHLNPEQQKRWRRLVGLLHNLPLPGHSRLRPATGARREDSTNADWQSPAVDGRGPQGPMELKSIVEDGRSDSDLPSVPAYQLLREVGRGGMGVVYQARHLALNRIVALKMILNTDLAKPEQLHRFKLEAELAARVHHPNVVAVHEVGQTHNRPFLAMEWVEGGSLSQKLRTDGLFSPQKAAELVLVLADAVQAAHSQGVIHRDLKPANVLLSSPQAACIPKIADFGLAKPIAHAPGLTTTGAILGTPEYMAPEQARADGPMVGPGCDIYALGVILYELLIGRPPFRADSLALTLQLVLETEPVAPHSLNPGVPRDLETICLKCLEKEPARRYSSARALADDLGRFLEGKPTTARPISVVGRGWRWGRRNVGYTLLGGLAGTLLLALVVGSVVFAFTEARLRRDIEDREAQAEAARDAARERFFQTVRNLNPVTRNGVGQQDPATAHRNSILMQSELCEAYLLGLPADRKRGPRDLAIVFYLGTIRAELGDRSAAEKLFDEAIAQAERLRTHSPSDENVASLLAFGYLRRGDHWNRSRRLKEATEDFARSRAHGRDWLAMSPTDSDAANLFLAATHRLQYGLYELGRKEESIETMKELIADCRRLCPPSPDRPTATLDLADHLRWLAEMLNQVGQMGEAVAPLTEAINLLPGLTVQGFPSLEAQIQWNTCLLQRAALYERLGRLEEAAADRKRLPKGASELKRLPNS